MIGKIGIWEHYDFRLDNPRYPYYSAEKRRKLNHESAVVLVTVVKGVISEVHFYADEQTALLMLKRRAKMINIQEEDAAVFNINGLVVTVEQYPSSALTPATT